MALRRILRGEDPALHKVCRPVEKFDKRLFTLLNDMKETMYNADGVGLAASQVGILRRVVVIDCGDGIIEMINPEITCREGEIGAMEGCLSFPGEQGYVVRAERVKARAQDRDGEWHEYDATELFARAIQHEIDHLDGRVYVDIATDPPEGYLEELENEFEEADE
ncbi:peptide deformylase [Eubacteriales bacterium OttesenSCG-928-K08]|nr:peptide deformylase [Eubacteriales bacterium OttesenSCG-928-K08]